VSADELRLHADKGAKLRANVGVQVRGVDVVGQLKLFNRTSTCGFRDRPGSRPLAIPVTPIRETIPTAVPVTIEPTVAPITVPVTERRPTLTPLKPTTIIPPLITTPVITTLETTPIPTAITIAVKPATTAATLVAVTLLVGGAAVAVGAAVPITAARA
jgi:hypothetical protein